MEVQRMDGKVAVISGGSSGVGLAVAKGLSRLGARTILLSRSEARGAEAARQIRQLTPGADVSVRVADLLSPRSVTQLVSDIAAHEAKVDVLVNATGSVGERGEVAAGIPRSFGTNYLTHFLLTRDMLPLLHSVAEPRVLIVGAAPAVIRRLGDVSLTTVDAQSSSVTVLRQSLAWRLLMARRLSDGFKQRVSATVFHPGLIRSELLRNQGIALRAFGSLSNHFASEFCPIADHLASARAPRGADGDMIDNRGRLVALPSSITAGNAAVTWDASESLAERLT